jgi:hypothetical protein
MDEVRPPECWLHSSIVMGPRRPRFQNLRTVGPVSTTDLLPIAAAFLFAAISTITNLGTTREFIGYDASVTLLRPIADSQQLDVWNRLYAPGSPSPLALLATPWVVTSAILTRLGAPSLILERLVYGLLIFSAFLGAYLLVKAQLGQLLRQPMSVTLSLASLFAASWYTFNPYSMLLMTFPSTPHELTWSLLPWGLLVVQSALTEKGSIWRVIVGGVIWALIFSGNVALTIVSVATGLALFGITAAILRVGRLDRYRNLGLLVIFVGFLTCYSWLPIAGAHARAIEGSSTINGLSTNVVVAAQFNSSRTSFTNLIRLDGSIAIPEQTYFPILNSLLFWVASCVLPLAAAASVIVVKRGRSYVLAIIAIGLVFLFLAKGEHPPFGEPMSWLYTHVAIAGIFRNSYDKLLLPVIVSEAILLGVSVHWVLNLSLAARIVLVAPILGAASLFLGLFLEGRVADSRYLVDVPQPYLQLQKFFDEQPTRPTIFSAPDLGGRANFTWYQGSAMPDPVLLDVPTVTEEWLRSEGVISSAVGGYRHAFELRESVDLLPRLGVGYLLIHKDAVPYILTGPYESRAKIATGGKEEAALLDAEATSRPEMRLVMDNAYFSLFRVCSGLVRPELYVTANTSVDVTASASPGPGAAECAGPGPQGYPTKLGAPQRVGSPGVAVSGAPVSTAGKIPTITVIKSSAGEKIVRLDGVQGPFALVLSQTFDDGWSASLAKVGAESAAPRVMSHLRADDRLNAWSGDGNGSYIADIEYQPEHLARMGAAVTTIAAAFAILTVITYLYIRLVPSGGWTVRLVRRSKSQPKHAVTVRE